MKTSLPRNNESLLVRTIRLFFHQIAEAFDSPEELQFRRLKRFVAE